MITLYTLRGRIGNEGWVMIGLPCCDLAPSIRDANRFVEMYDEVEVIHGTTQIVVHRATRSAQRGWQGNVYRSPVAPVAPAAIERIYQRAIAPRSDRRSTSKRK